VDCSRFESLQIGRDNRAPCRLSRPGETDDAVEQMSEELTVAQARADNARERDELRADSRARAEHQADA
jgi:hypothetical protein